MEERIMAIRTRTGNWHDARIGAATIMLAAMLIGCGQQKQAQDDAATSADNASRPETAPSIVLDPRLHQPFAEATISEPPEDWHRPPDTTLTGQSHGQLSAEVNHNWEQLRFVSPADEPVADLATLDTVVADIELTLRRTLAPTLLPDD